MEDAGHGESSSSPNDNITILSARKRAVGPFDRIELSDGFSFLIHPAFYPPFLCEPGTELSSEDVGALTFLSEAGKVWEKALDLLTRRNHSRRELKLKLLKKEFSENAIDIVLRRLVEKNLQSDASFAEQWVLSRCSRHPEGYNALLAGLLRKGVDRTCAAEVLEEVFTETTALEALERVWEKAERRGKSTEELESLAYRRGFRGHIIRRFRSGM